MTSFESLFDLQQACKKAARNPEQERALLDLVSKLRLNPTEEFILTHLYQPRVSDMNATLNQYAALLPFMRGEKEVVRPWLTFESVKALEIGIDSLESEALAMNLLRSLYVWHADDFHQPAVKLIDLFEAFTTGDFLFSDLVDDWANFYRRVSLLIMVKYFSELPTELQMVFVNSWLVFAALNRGLNVDKAISEAVTQFIMVVNRRELCLQLASFFYTNPTVLGKKTDGKEDATIMYWIEQFDLFSQKTFDGISLINFLQDKPRWRFTSSDHKELIQEGITLYAHLVSDYYVVPNLEAELTKPLAQPRSAPTPPAAPLARPPVAVSDTSIPRSGGVGVGETTARRVGSPALPPGPLPQLSWSDILLTPQFGEEAVNKITAWLKDQPNFASAKAMLVAQIKTINWQNDPAFTNLLTVSQLFEERFGQSPEPLVYFDEQEGKFAF